MLKVLVVRAPNKIVGVCLEPCDKDKAEIKELALEIGLGVHLQEIVPYRYIFDKMKLHRERNEA